jgi:hypothetical protein
MDTHVVANLRQIVWSRSPSPEGELSLAPVESPCAVDKYREHLGTAQNNGHVAVYRSRRVGSADGAMCLRLSN